MSKKLVILVACHKKSKVISNDNYIPIHVGKALHPELDFGYIGDDTGENISKLNPYYCELTAQYWAWKNLDCEYVGLCHYRRYFKTQFSDENIEEQLDGGNDIILSEPSYFGEPIIEVLYRAHCQEDIYIFVQIISEFFPEYL